MFVPALFLQLNLQIRLKGDPEVAPGRGRLSVGGKGSTADSFFWARTPFSLLARKKDQGQRRGCD